MVAGHSGTTGSDHHHDDGVCGADCDGVANCWSANQRCRETEAATELWEHLERVVLVGQKVTGIDDDDARAMLDRVARRPNGIHRCLNHCCGSPARNGTCVRWNRIRGHAVWLVRLIGIVCVGKQNS